MAEQAGGAVGGGARRVLGKIKAGAGRLAGGARSFLSRLAGGGINSRNVAARSKGVRQKFGAGGPSAAQRATIERKGLASPIGGGGGE
jgi:hypothetical protein